MEVLHPISNLTFCLNIEYPSLEKNLLVCKGEIKSQHGSIDQPTES